jgi:hypothetical protein
MITMPDDNTGHDSGKPASDTASPGPETGAAPAPAAGTGGRSSGKGSKAAPKTARKAADKAAAAAPAETPAKPVAEPAPAAPSEPARSSTAEATRAAKQKVVGRISRAAEKASRVAKDVIEAAGETARGAIDVAGDTTRSVLQATTIGAQTVAKLAEDSARIAVQLAGEGARAAGQLAQDMALQMAQTYLRKSPVTIDLAESQINKYLRDMAKKHPQIDYVTLICGDDRLTVMLDGHYKRVVYTVKLAFDVLEFKVSREARYLRVRQVDEVFDAQLRQGNLISNFATRRIAGTGFKVANRLPTYAPVKMLLESLPGLRQEGPRLWHVDLDQTDLMDLLNDRAWMIDKLLKLGERVELPGLATLKDSREMLMQLVNQFEIRDMRVRPGRLEMLVGINS